MSIIGKNIMRRSFDSSTRGERITEEQLAARAEAGECALVSARPGHVVIGDKEITTEVAEELVVMLQEAIRISRLSPDEIDDIARKHKTFVRTV